MKDLQEGVISSFVRGNGLFKKTCKRVRDRNGRLVHVGEGDERRTLRATGDSVRGSLNKNTFYGAFMRDGVLCHGVRKQLSDFREEDVDKIVDDGLRRQFQAFVKAHGFGALKGDFGVAWEGGHRPRSVRLFTNVKNPLTLKQQAYPSRHEYKRGYHVINDRNGNYAMAVYEGVDAGGKRKVRMVMLSNLEAARRRKANPGAPLFPEVDRYGFRLLHVLRNGMLVLFYENDPSEVYGCSERELSRRLHRITGLSQQDGRGAVTFVHHLEARGATGLGKPRAAWSSGQEYRGRFDVREKDLRILVEGEDFRISVTGRIEFLHGKLL
jgi:CRISPR-associated endonuclease Csn1